ncbi:sulfate adenylyltransferase subunit CysN [Acidisphaera sp. S103]|uniref:sulfate adenylyltransferase subunit CysN n=1 Tax=Acidisphaera sp. S103 TaxID=1747223 RepID=UPI00131CD252|nr:sulfate adenylyltransferase subunit CysN [Acidisphaera sp. S103]
MADLPSTLDQILQPTGQEKELLRFLTCGSVDDGKSSLIGRLLYDSKLIFEDQLSAVERDSRKHGTVGDEVDLALLVDGLEAEREQGITIDVAYRYFTTPRRAFIVADTPGHEQYTRNMATGASTADLAIILVDARKGVLTQTKRHSYICSMLGIRSIVLAVNKMDLVDFAGDRFYQIVSDYVGFAKTLGFATISPIPLSARYGDNVTVRSERTPWYDGPTLIQQLETADVASDLSSRPLRFPVQWVNRPNLDFRGFSGTVASGTVKVGDDVVVAATGATAKIARVVTFDGDRDRALPGDAVTLILGSEIDVTRGDLLTHPDARPECVDQLAAHILWMSQDEMLPGRSYLMRVGTAETPASITTLRHKIDVNTLEHSSGRTLALNEIGLCNISTTHPIAFDPYSENRRTGAFVLIDRTTNATAGAGMISFGLRRATNIHRQHHAVDKAARAALSHQKPRIVWFTGLSGSGKSTIADLVEKSLHARGMYTMLLDGDNLRHGLNRDLGFTEADRVENIRRVGEVAKLFVEAGLLVICCFISPFESERAMVRALVEPDEFVEVFVDVPIEECIKRDPKGLYKKALAGELQNFTGINSPYQAPTESEVIIDGVAQSADRAAEQIVTWLLAH